ncbi:MAG TPA: hypothetical protein HPP79_13455 [Gammaproteobacteria bacterium]|nr:hypothetical protein [Gammaproteobacteria bacterium]
MPLGCLFNEFVELGLYFFNLCLKGFDDFVDGAVTLFWHDGVAVFFHGSHLNKLTPSSQ